MQYPVICPQWLTEMHSGALVLEMYWLMHHSALLLIAAVEVFVIFYAIFNAHFQQALTEQGVREMHTDVHAARAFR